MVNVVVRWSYNVCKRSCMTSPYFLEVIGSDLGPLAFIFLNTQSCENHFETMPIFDICVLLCLANKVLGFQWTCWEVRNSL